MVWSQLARCAVSGTAITVGSVVIPCVMAVKIEQAANRALFTYFPSKFSNVPHALGIEDWELEENKRKHMAAATWTSEFLPVTLHEDNDETTFSNVEFKKEKQQQIVPPRCGLVISDKEIYASALTS